MADIEVDGAFIKRPAGEDVGGHRVIRNSNGSARLADASTVGHGAGILGITTGAASSGDEATIQVYGPLTDPAWTWTPGLPIYCGAAGVLTQTPPAEGFLRQVAIAETATRIFIDLQPLLILT